MQRRKVIWIGLVMSPVVMAADAVLTSTFSNVAVSGYDPTAYFTQQQAIEGNKAFTLQYEGADYRFASAENLELFKSDPEQYLPQYGGYCAYAVAQGYTASIDPQAWSVVDGKLYLNYSTGVRSRWLQDVPGYISAADSNWPGVLN